MVEEGEKNMKNYFIIALLLLLLAPSTNAASSPKANDLNHALYISVLEISHSATSSSAQIKIKIFANDLGDALQNELNQRISFDSLSVKKGIIIQYFLIHLKLKVNGVESKLSIAKIEENGDSIWLYFHTNTPAHWESIYIEADYLMELFPTQSNIVSITNGDEKRFAKLSIDNTSVTEVFSH